MHHKLTQEGRTASPLPHFVKIAETNRGSVNIVACLVYGELLIPTVWAINLALSLPTEPKAKEQIK